MRKKDEITSRISCIGKALDCEMIFVLLARDEAAPIAIRAWIAERIKLGKNFPGDPLMLDAEQCAATMESERDATRQVLQGKRDDWNRG